MLFYVYGTIKATHIIIFPGRINYLFSTRIGIYDRQEFISLEALIRFYDDY